MWSVGTLQGDPGGLALTLDSGQKPALNRELVPNHQGRVTLYHDMNDSLVTARHLDDMEARAVSGGK